MNGRQRFRLILRPQTLLVLTFAALVAIGAVLLSLPICHADPRNPVSPLDALFTATSAVCVTGLITRDTATDFSRTGQIVILVLIQLGGLGIMTFGAMAFQLVGRRLSFSSVEALRDMFFQHELRGSLRAAAGRIVLLTFGFEALGAALLYQGLRASQAGGVFEAVFLAVSAFCNAGFSVYSDSLMSLRHSTLVVFTVMGLIVVGGLGYSVLLEIGRQTFKRLRRRREPPVVWSLHTKLVLVTTAGLIVLGTALLLITGVGREADTAGGALLAALFQSITARTAGFNTVPIGALPVPALLILIPLMFVGGSPGSCAGGIKTSTATVWLARTRARLLGQPWVALFGRRIPTEILRRAVLVVSLAMLWNLVGIFLLTVTEHVGDGLRFEQVIFEQISAFGTVGLSTGLTPHLSPAGKLWIIASMFAGRVGPLTVALAVIRPRTPPPYTYPYEPVMIG